ncbi:hypothetical protein FRC06_010871 [Ceratobasidium sp. 370]|nr:hypothetical protein FRC06_010871 [Ceratobasidium sp. 370]
MAEYTHIINGKAVTSSKKIDVINPATQRKIAEVPVATKEQLDEAVAAARAALPAWSAKSPDERAEVLNQIAGVIEKNLEEYKKILTSEQGKTLNNAQMEIGGAVLWLRETAKIRVPDKVLIDNEQQRVIERRVPIGVPSPFTPLTTLRFVTDIQPLLPPGVVNVLSGDDGLGPMITVHPGFDKVSFTGSSETGKKVMQSASLGLKRLTLELGGNDPCIILPDVEPKKAVSDVFWAAFVNNGQTCSAAKRLYIHEKIYDEFRDALVEFSKTVKVGNGTDPDSQLGPVQNITQFVIYLLSLYS